MLIVSEMLKISCSNDLYLNNLNYVYNCIRISYMTCEPVVVLLLYWTLFAHSYLSFSFSGPAVQVVWMVSRSIDN